ncbi:hypothetical protein DAPPUDRAFT_305555 [Daphnia pulex]|uniref:Uncharacterized protein n=1 Tax=Daphnia pulex TaxID=6669 RepID=E9FXX0_DAPPU|nr:hypothetical protein DAPPUDRAFT_305555 [Daphnia pulex]|eukprot:EFX88176.1 hypothetical protein DAPPUDRAFT_305555 [Daphnia pulex]
MHGVLIFFDFFVFHILFLFLFAKLLNNFEFRIQPEKLGKLKKNSVLPLSYLRVCVCVYIIRNNPSLNVSASLRVAPPCGCTCAVFISFILL